MMCHGPTSVSLKKTIVEAYLNTGHGKVDTWQNMSKSRIPLAKQLLMCIQSLLNQSMFSTLPSFCRWSQAPSAHWLCDDWWPSTPCWGCSESVNLAAEYISTTWIHPFICRIARQYNEQPDYPRVRGCSERDVKKGCCSVKFGNNWE